MGWAVRGRSAQVFGDSIWQLEGAQRRIGLTFDDGPTPATEAVLELLERFGAKATFFQCGENAQRYPGISRKVTAAGHTIGNHTWSHPNLAFTSRTTQRLEIGRTQELLQQLHGAAPRWFRAPYGVRWAGLGGVQREFGLKGAMWSCIGLDWKLDAQSIVARVTAATRPGAIICLHDGSTTAANPDRGNLLAALRRLLAYWQGEGYRVGGLPRNGGLHEEESF